MPRFPAKIYEDENVLEYLKRRGLLKQYVRACKKLLSGNVGGSDIKQRKPTGSGIRSFRINRQFRAIGYWREAEFVVVDIDNHR